MARNLRGEAADHGDGSGFLSLHTQFPEQIIRIGIARQPACLEISQSPERGGIGDARLSADEGFFAVGAFGGFFFAVFGVKTSSPEQGLLSTFYSNRIPTKLSPLLSILPSVSSGPLWHIAITDKGTGSSVPMG